jgi:tRNA(His) guanylyltransferase
MHFEDLDILMRRYEEVNDTKVLPYIYMVARLDGKGFSKFTKKQNFKKPFDFRLKEAMLETTKYLMTETGFSFIYGYTQSDEISLLFSVDENTFNRKLRKLNSVLAGLASAKFTHYFGSIASFDCRISQLPSKELVEDYFSWRQADSIRNCLNGYVFWDLVSQGYSSGKATSFMHGLTSLKKKEYLLGRSINFNTITPWHKKGLGLYFDVFSKEGFNPQLNETTITFKRRLIVEENLPLDKNYREFISQLLNDEVINK